MYSADNMGGYSGRNIPVAPLPNPGEGGPAAPGDAPALPLPGFGEGGPVFGGDTPSIPLPNPGEGGPAAPGPGGNFPVVPLPNPGEGGPVAPGRPGQTIPILPAPNPPCFYCGAGRFGKVRFLNAAFGYRPFRIFINNRFIVNGLGFTSLTPYGRVSNGFQTVTVTGTNGYVYLQKSIPFKADDSVTIAVINSASGLDLLQISDTSCARPASMSCFRACNLAYYSNPVDILLGDGRVIYSDVRFKEVTSFKRIRPGDYQIDIAETNLRPEPRMADIETLDGGVTVFELPQALVSTFVTIRPNATYTLYIFSRDTSPDALQTMIVEDR